MQPTSLAVTSTAPRAVARDAPAAPALTLAADTRFPGLLALQGRGASFNLERRYIRWMRVS
jgi:hypothetical protein